MKVPLRELPTSLDLELDNGFVRDAVAGLPLRVALERPEDDPDAGRASAHLELYQEGDGVFASGQVSGWIEVACSRCVGPVRIPVDERVTVTFLPKERVPDDDDQEVEVTEDDLDLFPYEGEEIDLAQLLREQLILAVPYAPLCRPDCKGLCSQCGADLNQAECGCQREILDPRLAPLRALGQGAGSRTDKKDR